MTKLIFGVFAHPDDEAFGPSGTLLLETRAGTELHLITLTAGENGQNPDSHEDLGAVRFGEWKAAGALLGATSMHHFGYEDGRLGNIDHVEIAQRLEALIRQTTEGRNDITEIELMSTDLNGISGHIDHIIAGRSAVLVFERLRTSGLPLRRVRLATIPRSSWDTTNTDFVLMEPGRPDEEITETIDARSVVSEVYTIMRTHHTQRGDGEGHIARQGDAVAINHFYDWV